MGEMVRDSLNLEFSKKCDAVLYTMGLPQNDLDRLEYLKNFGYYMPGFYMLHPFHYVGVEKYPFNALIKGGVLFICIWEEKLGDIDLEKIASNVYRDIDPKALESMPIVVFRNYRGKICIPIAGVNNDLSGQYHCQKDTFEFIGVYKAKKNPQKSSYRLTKIFDRFYFDDSKTLKP